jgi:peptidoglycan/LPS O-acetylase OafA/YrhL
MHSNRRHVPSLDGFRGIAASWVLLGHAAIQTGFKVPVLDKPDLGVDLFILLSGFLMVFHYVGTKGPDSFLIARSVQNFYIPVSFSHRAALLRAAGCRADPRPDPF